MRQVLSSVLVDISRKSSRHSHAYCKEYALPFANFVVATSHTLGFRGLIVAGGAVSSSHSQIKRALLFGSLVKFSANKAPASAGLSNIFPASVFFSSDSKSGTNACVFWPRVMS
jgi:hypothetical protein